MANLSFAAQIADWVHEVEGAAKEVFQKSVRDLADEVTKGRNEGGRMRIDTGFLRASLLASTSAMPHIIAGSGPEEGKSYPADFGQIEAVLAGADIGDTIYLGFTAGYAAYREFGANGQPADAFVRTSAQKWPQIVDQVTAELKGKKGL